MQQQQPNQYPYPQQGQAQQPQGQPRQAPPQNSQPQGQYQPPDPFAKAGTEEILQKGSKLDTGTYWLVIEQFFIRTSTNKAAGTEGQQTGIMEARVLRNCNQADQNGHASGPMPPTKIGITKGLGNSGAFYSTFSPILGALAGIDDPNQVMGTYYHAWMNEPSATQYAVIEISVSKQISQANREYIRVDNVRLMSDSEIEQYAASNPQVMASVLPYGTRTQMGLPSPVEHLASVAQQ